MHITGYSPLGNNFFGVTLLVNEPKAQIVADRLSKVHNRTVTPAQVIIAWGHIGGHSIIPKSYTPSRIAENFNQIELDDKAVKDLAEFGVNPQRFTVPVNCGFCLFAKGE